MLLSKFRYFKSQNVISHSRLMSSKNNKFEPAIQTPSPENPFQRTTRILANDMKKVGRFFGIGDESKTVNKINKNSIYLRDNFDERQFQTHCDVLVIGGGGVGSSVAYWLKKQARKGLHVVVAEKDNTVSLR